MHGKAIITDMKVMLITPPSRMQERYGDFHEAGALYPPIGPAYLAASAENAGHEVIVIDAEATGESFDVVEQRICDEQPDVIGMQTFCANLERCFRTARLAKRMNPDTVIVLGGVQVTIFPEESLKRTEVDIVVRGEGEATFVDLLDALEKGRPLEKVKGIVWKKEGEYIYNELRPLIRDLDQLPFPALHLFPMMQYHSSSQLRGKRTLHMFTSRGCPYHCAYCSGDLIFGSTFRYHSAERIVRDMIRLRDEYGADSLQFYDETFTVNRKRVTELCRAIIEKGIEMPWTCFTRVDIVDEELLRLMKQAGCYQIFFGVETGVPRLLKMIRKETTLKQARNAFHLTRKIGIETVASFMLTLPTETVEETQESIRFGLELDPDYVYWLTFTPYPGTKLTEIAKQSGEIKNSDYASYNVFNEIVYIPEGRTEEEIRRTLASAYRRFYLRPGYLLRRLKSLLHLPPSKIWNLFIGGFRTFIRSKI